MAATASMHIKGCGIPLPQQFEGCPHPRVRVKLGLARGFTLTLTLTLMEVRVTRKI